MSLKMFKVRLARNFFDYRGQVLNASNIKTVVIFAPRQLGDTMSIFPIIRSLQKHGVEKIFFISTIYAKELLEPLLSDNFNIFFIRDSRSYKGIIKVVRKIKKMANEVDLCIQAMHRDSAQTIVFQGLLKSKMNIGLHRSDLKMYGHSLNSSSLKLVDNDTPPPVFWANLMSSIGMPDVPGRYEIVVPIAAKQKVSKLYHSPNEFMLFNLDGSVAKRQLNEDVACEIIEKISSHFSGDILLACLPSEKNKAKNISKKYKHVFFFEEIDSIVEVAALLKYSRFVISPDTSIVHMASAYDKPIIAIYNGVLDGWRPLSKNKKIIFSKDGVSNLNISEMEEAVKFIVGNSQKESLCD